MDFKDIFRGIEEGTEYSIFDGELKLKRRHLPSFISLRVLLENYVRNNRNEKM